MAPSRDSLNCVFHKNRIRWIILNVHFPVTRIVFYSSRCNALELHNIHYNLRKVILRNADFGESEVHVYEGHNSQ